LNARIRALSVPAASRCCTYGLGQADAGERGARVGGVAAPGGRDRLRVLVAAHGGVAVALGLVLLLGFPELARDGLGRVARLAHREAAQRLDERVVAHEHELRVHHRAAGAVARDLAGDDLVAAQELAEGARVVGRERLVGREPGLVQRVDDVRLGEDVEVLARHVRDQAVAHRVGRLHALVLVRRAEHVHQQAGRVRVGGDALLGPGGAERKASDEARGDGRERLVVPSLQ
jgi:hypothetical protein